MYSKNTQCISEIFLASAAKVIEYFPVSSDFLDLVEPENNQLTIFQMTQINESFKMTAKYILLKMIHLMVNMKFANTAKDELPGR